MNLTEVIKFLESNQLTVRHSHKNEDFIIKEIAPLDSADKSDISYVNKDKYLLDLTRTNAGAVLVNAKFAKYVPTHTQILEVENPYLAFAYLTHLFTKPEFANPKHNFALDFPNPAVTIAHNVFIGSNVNIGDNTHIMPGVCISDNVSIGENCKIYPNVVIYRDTKIGDNVRIHAGSIIGSDGFGYAQTKDGRHIKIEHNGRVIIENDVEIGANSTIDRAVFGETLVAQGAIIDNLVQVAHNCRVGENSILVAQTGLAGSSILGRSVIMGGQSGTGGHINIGDFVQVAGRGAVGKNLPANTKWGGHPLMELEEWMKFYVNLRRFLKQKLKEQQ